MTRKKAILFSLGTAMTIHGLYESIRSFICFDLEKDDGNTIDPGGTEDAKDNGMCYWYYGMLDDQSAGGGINFAWDVEAVTGACLAYSAYKFDC